MSGRHYHDPELAGATDVDAGGGGGGGGGGGESVRRLDFQARRVTGGRRERFWRGRVLCLVRISTHEMGSETRFVSEPLRRGICRLSGAYPRTQVVIQDFLKTLGPTARLQSV